MKTVGVVLLVVASFVASTYSFPGARDNGNNEEKGMDTVLVLPSNTRDRVISRADDFLEPALDDSFEDPVWNLSNLFRSSIMDRWYSDLQANMRRLRDHLAGIFSRIPEEGTVNWSKIPEGANTTSTTKIIDGHVVTINETRYTDSNDEFGSAFILRVIDVRPLNDTILQTESDAGSDVTTLPPGVTTRRTSGTANNEGRTTPARSVETVEDFENEIPKNQVDTLTA
ncbi:icarapin-like [Xylocopa sonorina]|uniref:icarapin-like n=1 Tax=Xylocopa sonorina TaxID=1818115 RepID=UPI00403B36E2